MPVLPDPPQRRLLLAVSGGLDSMCLLDLALRHWRGVADIAVAHVNHGLRGMESDADEALVHSIARQADVSFLCRRIPAVTRSGKGLEADLRTRRYELLFEMAGQWANGGESPLIVTAHHADDQAETLLLRMMRGTGIRGLQGILPLRSDGVWRPLLEWTRADLHQWAVAHSVPWRDDASNQSFQFGRNRIRHGLLPVLTDDSAVGKNHVVRQLCRISERSRSVWPRLETLILQYFSGCEEPPVIGSAIRWSANRLALKMEESPVLLTLLPLYLQITAELRGVRPAWEESQLRRFPALLAGKGPRRMQLSDGWLLERAGRMVCLVPPPKPLMYLLNVLPVDSRGTVCPEAGRVLVRVQPGESAMRIRHPEIGDRFVVQNGGNPVRLVEFLRAQGVSASVRSRLPLVVVGNEVVWIPGVAVAGNRKMAPDQPAVELELVECPTKNH